MRKLILVVVSVIAGLVLSELGLRVLRVVPSTGVATVTEAEYARVPGIFRPGQHVLDTRIPKLPHRVTINSLGYRGPEPGPADGPGGYRILFVGDSFVYGDFVDDDETLPARFERDLGARCPGARTINAGVGGATIRDYVEVLDRGVGLKPDLVVLGFTENDVADLGGFDMWQSLAANRRAKSSFPLGLVYPWASDTALWQLALKVRGKLLANRAPPPPRGTVGLGAGDNPAVVAHQGEYREQLIRFKEKAEAAGLPFVLVAFPSHLTQLGQWSHAQLDWVGSVAEELHIPFFDLSASNAAAEGTVESLYLLPYDGHPSPLGYQVASRALLEWLLATDQLACVRT